jgi:hypothetical protein
LLTFWLCSLSGFAQKREKDVSPPQNSFSQLKFTTMTKEQAAQAKRRVSFAGTATEIVFDVEQLASRCMQVSDVERVR